MSGARCVEEWGCLLVNNEGACNRIVVTIRHRDQHDGTKKGEDARDRLEEMKLR